MASTDIVMHITADTEMGEAIMALAKEVPTMRREFNALRDAFDVLRTQFFREVGMEGGPALILQVIEVRDGLDAWAGRIQRLEALPGVAEAIEATGK